MSVGLEREPSQAVEPASGQSDSGGAGRAAERPTWPHRHLLDTDVLTGGDVELVMATADAMKQVLARPIPTVPALRGRNVTLLFYEASTRTRVCLASSRLYGSCSSICGLSIEDCRYV